MALTHGSVEIISERNNTSDGVVVSTPDVSQLPVALETIRGLTSFASVAPIPTEQREIGTFVYRQIAEGEFVRELRVEIVDTPVADAMWTATAPNGDAVQVYFRENRVLSPDEIAASIALADMQVQRQGEASNGS